MLKLSKDKTKVKRRIPFKVDNINKELMDDSMVYLEKFPIEVGHQQLAEIFSRAGKVRHVSLPKFKNSGEHKGFAFIEFDSAEKAQ